MTSEGLQSNSLWEESQLIVSFCKSTLKTGWEECGPLYKSNYMIYELCVINTLERDPSGHSSEASRASSAPI